MPVWLRRVVEADREPFGVLGAVRRQQPGLRVDQPDVHGRLRAGGLRRDGAARGDQLHDQRRRRQRREHSTYPQDISPRDRPPVIRSVAPLPPQYTRGAANLMQPAAGIYARSLHRPLGATGRAGPVRARASSRHADFAFAPRAAGCTRNRRPSSRGRRGSGYAACCGDQHGDEASGLTALASADQHARRRRDRRPRRSPTRMSRELAARATPRSTAVSASVDERVVTIIVAADVIGAPPARGVPRRCRGSRVREHAYTRTTLTIATTKTMPASLTRSRRASRLAAYRAPRSSAAVRQPFCCLTGFCSSVQHQDAVGMARAEQLLVVEHLDELAGVQRLHLVRRLAVGREDLIEVRHQQERSSLPVLSSLTLMLAEEMWTRVPSTHDEPTGGGLSGRGGDDRRRDRGLPR